METVVDFLRDEHKRLHGLSRQLEALNERENEMRLPVMRELLMELETHVDVLREVGFPALKELSSSHLNRDEAIQLGIVISACLDVMDELDSLIRTAPFDEVMEQMDLHMEQVEDDLVPLVCQFGQFREQTELLQRLHAKKHELMRSHRYRGALPEQVQNPHGGEQKRKIVA